MNELVKKRFFLKNLEMEQSTSFKFDTEVHWLCCLSRFHRSSAFLVLTVTLNIHDTMEIGVSQGNCD